MAKKYYAIKSKLGYLIAEDSVDYDKDIVNAHIFTSRSAANATLKLGKATEVAEQEWIVELRLEEVK